MMPSSRPIGLGGPAKEEGTTMADKKIQPRTPDAKADKTADRAAARVSKKVSRKVTKKATLKKF
jgi:hypothetical protein